LEPITHFLTGACLSRAGFNRKTALCTLTMVLASEAPDLDIVTLTGGRIFYFAHHRGITHTFVGAPFVAALVVGFVYLVHRLRQRVSPPPQGCPGCPPVAMPGPEALPTTPRWGLLFLFAWIAVNIHILLDYTNSYGVRPFEPFSYKWYSWDIVFIYEPVLYFFLFAGLIFPALFGLINEEIGVRRRGPRGRGGAIFALVGIVLVWGVRDFEHRRAVAALQARTYQDEQPLRVSAFPYSTDPFRWYGVVETDDFFARTLVNSRAPEVDPDGGMVIRYKPERSAPAEAAKGSYLGRVYLDWAQYPYAEVIPQTGPENGYVVHLFDLRFYYPDRPLPALGGGVELNRRLEVVAEWLGLRTNASDERGGSP